MYKYLIYLSIILTLKCINGAPLGVFRSNPEDMSVLEHNPTGYATYGHQQQQMAKIRGIKPLVDTIREEEKYGNDGSQHIIGQTVIKLSEGASSALSNTIGKPNENTYNILEPFFPILTPIGEKIGGI